VTRVIRIGLSCALLLLAACGSPQDQSAEQSTTSSTETSLATSTTSVPDTTVPEPTTTTTSPNDDDGEGDTESLLSSLDASAEITSGRIEGSIEMTGLDDSTSGVSEGVILFSSSFDATTGDSSFLMDMSSLMGSIEADETDPFGQMAAGMFSDIEFRQIGDTAYVRFPLFTAMFGAETEWVSMPAEEGDDFASDFETMPTDPNELIATFDTQGASVEVVSNEAVNGVEAIHYRVSLDTDAMELTAEEQAELAESGIFGNSVIPLEIWISEDGYMVRMIMEIDGSGMDAPTDEQFETMTLRYDLFDVNGDVVIEPPPASQVTSMEELEGAFSFDP
jgi:hypothetical protein